MKLFKKNENKKTTKLPMTGKVKKGLGLYLRCVPFCGYGIYQIQRYDRRTVCLGVD